MKIIEREDITLNGWKTKFVYNTELPIDTGIEKKNKYNFFVSFFSW